MQIPKTNTLWADKSAEKLECSVFEVFFTKMDNIQEECGDSPRKQTKQETLVEGLKNVINKDAAKKLKGTKFVVSKSGRRLHLTDLPTQVLRSMPLHPDYQKDIDGAGSNNDPFGASNPFGSLAKSTPAGGQDNDSKRIAYATKQMFLALLASMEIVYCHEDNDLLVLEVIDMDEKPDSVNAIVEGLFDNGEHPDAREAFTISFGKLKDIS